MEALIHHFKLFTTGIEVPAGGAMLPSSRRAASSVVTWCRTGQTALPDAHPRGQASSTCKASRRFSTAGCWRTRSPSCPRRPRARGSRSLMGHLSEENLRRASAIVDLYQRALGVDSALPSCAEPRRISLRGGRCRHRGPLWCHARRGSGYASFYDMLKLEPVGRYVVAVCTNIACMLSGSYELLSHAQSRLGVSVGQTTSDGLFTIEEAECLAGATSPHASR